MPKTAKTVGFGTFLNPEAEFEQKDLDRKMLMAALLKKQANTAIDPNVNYAISPLEGLGKIAQALAGSKMEKDADEQEREVSKKNNEMLIRALNGGSAQNKGSQPANKDSFDISRLLQGKAIEQVGGTSAASAFWDDAKKTSEQKNWEAQDLDPKQVGQFALREQASKGLMSIPQGNTIYDPLTGQTGFSSPKLSEGQVYQNGQVFNAPGAVGAASQMEGAKAGAKAGAEASFEPYQVTAPDGKTITTNKFSASQAGGILSPSKADLNTSEKLQTAMADKLIESGARASEASQNIVKLSRLRDAVSSGDIITGPGTDWRLATSQIANSWGIQGKNDEEKLLRTREVIQGLARMSLDNVSLLKDPRITDQERAMLKDAASGDLSRLTKPELSTLLGVFDMANRDLIGQNNAIADNLKDQPVFSGMAKHYRVSMPEEYKSRTNPQTGATTPSKVSSQQEYNALPSGSSYIAPDGSVRRKK